LIHNSQLHARLSAASQGHRKLKEGKNGNDDKTAESPDTEHIGALSDNAHLQLTQQPDPYHSLSKALVVLPNPETSNQIVIPSSEGQLVPDGDREELAETARIEASAAKSSATPVPPSFPKPKIDDATLRHVKRLLPTVKPVAVATAKAVGKLTVILEPRPPAPVLTDDQQMERLSWSRRFCPFYGPDKNFSDAVGEASPAYDVKMYSEYDRPALMHKIHGPLMKVPGHSKVTEGLFPHRPGVLEKIILSHTENVHAIESIVHGALGQAADHRLLPQEFSSHLRVARQKLDDLDARFYREGHTRKNAMHGATFREVQRQVLTHPYQEPSQEDIILLALALQRKKDADASFDLQAAAAMQRRDTAQMRKSLTRAFSVIRSNSLLGNLRSKSIVSGASSSGTASPSGPSRAASWVVQPNPNRPKLQQEGLSVSIVLESPASCEGPNFNLGSSLLLKSIDRDASESFRGSDSPRKADFSQTSFDPSMASNGFMNRDNSITPSVRLALHKLELVRMRDQFQTERFNRTVLSEADIGVTESQTVDEYQRRQFEMEKFIQNEEAVAKRRLLDTLEKKPLPQLTFSRIPKKP
jgi:hypothetical protein